MDVPAPPIVNERGERLLAFRPASADPPSPPRFALALLLRQSRVLLVHNARRDVWELPGGWIDPGESARDCARREFREETGWRANHLSLRGWVLVGRGHEAPGDTCAGAVFAVRGRGGGGAPPPRGGAGGAGRGRRAPPRPADGEILAATRWPLDALPPQTSAIDRWLIARIAAAGHDRGRLGAP